MGSTPLVDIRGCSLISAEDIAGVDFFFYVT